MSMQRREFLGASLATAAVLAARARAAQGTPAAAPKQLDLLVLGGTGFLGPAIVAAAQARGHKLTLFNRGKTNKELFPDIEKLRGDRDPNKGEGIKALAGRKWDAVFDDCGYYPRMVKASAELLAPNVGQYFFVSSISCYAKNEVEGMDETAACATMADPALETMGKGYEFYGSLKALCEQAAQAAFPQRATIIRPGYIVGPGDYSGRFTYWPVRCDRGGDIFVPGTPADPFQVIDVRDLAEWMVLCAEQKTTGVFNAVGPNEPLTWGAAIEACKAASSAKEMRFHWASPEQLEKHKDEKCFQETSFEPWLPHVGETKGAHSMSNQRAVAAGLKSRPITAVAKDTLAWWKTVPDGDRAKKLSGPTAEQEAEMLKLIAS